MESYKLDYFRLTNVVSYKKRFSDKNELSIYCTNSLKRFHELTSGATRSLWVHYLQDVKDEDVNENTFTVLKLEIVDDKDGRNILEKENFSFEKIDERTYCYKCKSSQRGTFPVNKRVQIRFNIKTIIKKSASRVFFRIVRPTRNFSCSFHANPSTTKVNAAMPLTFLVTSAIPKVDRDENGSKCKVNGTGWFFKNSGVVFPWDD